MTCYESVARMIALHASSNLVVVEKSTVPVKTASMISEIMEACKKKKTLHFEIISVWLVMNFF